ncbi:MAG: CRTAC1 family protein [Pirellulales bacterium]
MPEQLASTEPTCAIYRNKGNVKFQQVTVASRMIKPGYCQGVTVGDYDNDGFDDLYITALGSNALFHNQGDGTFVELTAQLGVDDSRWSTSCAFADVNLDGALDLYVVNYLDDSPTNPLLCRNEKSPTGFEQCPPAKYNGVNDRLFLGDGAGGFIDVTASSGLGALAGKGLGVVVCDFDKVGLPEIYVTNDGQANYLFHLSIDSQGVLKLNEIAMTSGTALSAAGYAQASMGVAAGDYDRDGLIDLHITNFYGDYNTVYKNHGELRFDDVTRLTGMAGPSKKFLGWGTVFADFDADGWLDLFVANGHVEDRTWNGRGEPFQMQPQLFRNTRDGRFAENSIDAGEYFTKAWLGRGVATVDLNHDNAIDLVIAHQLVPPVILLNNRTGHGMSLELVGTASNRNGLGAKIRLRNSNSQLENRFDVLVSGASFLSAVENRVYISKGTEIEVFWPSGSVEIVSLGGSCGGLIVETTKDSGLNLDR